MKEAAEIARLTQVSRIYLQGRIEVKAVDRLNLTIMAEEFSALCGPSGSGKTTILNLIGAWTGQAPGASPWKGGTSASSRGANFPGCGATGSVSSFRPIIWYRC